MAETTTTEEAASHSGGDYGKGGDILYRWGNPQNYSRGDILMAFENFINQENEDGSITKIHFRDDPVIQMRIIRDELLKESDWLAGQDRTMTSAEKTYRQALRDITDTQTPALDDNGNLINVTWPAKPPILPDSPYLNADRS